ncbi:MAG: DUF4430 domain-containing protein [Candidatus Hodarchaeota archaeon]
MGAVASQKAWMVSAVLLLTTIGLATTTVYYYTQSDYYQRSFNAFTTDYISADVNIDYGNGTDVWYNGTLILRNSSVFKLTVAIADVNYTFHPVFGIFVNGINNITSYQINGTSGYSWLYYVNGAAAPVGSDQYIVALGDVIEWRFEFYSF